MSAQEKLQRIEQFGLWQVLWGRIETSKALMLTQNVVDLRYLVVVLVFRRDDADAVRMSVDVCGTGDRVLYDGDARAGEHYCTI